MTKELECDAMSTGTTAAPNSELDPGSQTEETASAIHDEVKAINDIAEDEANAGTETKATARTPGEELMSKPPPVVCTHCKNFVDVKNARLRNKGKQEWRCNKCACKISALTRHYKVWPPAVFDSLNEEQRTAFFNLESSNKDELLRHVTVTAEKYKRDEEYYGAGGDFEPLSVYKQKGYTESQLDNLEKNSRDEDKRWDPVMECWTYRKIIMSKGERGSIGKQSQQTINGTFKKQRCKLVNDKAKFLPDGSDDDDESDDSSSSSSSAHGDAVLARQKAERKQKRQQRKVNEKAAKKLKKATEAAKLAAKTAKEKSEKAARKAKRDKAKEERKLKKESQQRERAKNVAAAQKGATKGAKPKVDAALKSLRAAKHAAELGGGAMQYGALLDHHITTLEQLATSCASVLAGEEGAKLPEALSTTKAINSEITSGQKTASFVSQHCKQPK